MSRIGNSATMLRIGLPSTHGVLAASTQMRLKYLREHIDALLALFRDVKDRIEDCVWG
jgi:hypothetical protein